MHVARSQTARLPLCLLLCLCERASRRASGLHCVCTGHPWCMIASCIAGTVDASPRDLSDLLPQFRFLLLLLAGQRSPMTVKKAKGKSTLRANSNAQRRLSFQLSQPRRGISQLLGELIADNMAPERKAKPPSEAALAASSTPLAPGSARLSVQVSTLPVMMNHTLCSCLGQIEPLGMQALSSPSVGPSPTRLRSGKLVGKVMDIVDMCIDCLSQQSDRWQVPDWMCC